MCLEVPKCGSEDACLIGGLLGPESDMPSHLDCSGAYILVLGQAGMQYWIVNHAARHGTMWRSTGMLLHNASMVPVAPRSTLKLFVHICVC